MEKSYPHVSSNIIDNSVKEYQENLALDNVLTVITADKGRDSKLLNFNSVEAILDEFCINRKPNPKHGQALLETLAAVKAGASATIMRVVPSNAYLPNGIFGIEVEDFTLIPPAVSLVLTPDAASGLLGTGEYKYKVIYKDATGVTVPSAESTIITTADSKKVNVTITVKRPEVTHVRLFRSTVDTTADTNTYKLVAELAVNGLTTTYTDNIADASLTDEITTVKTSTLAYKKYVSRPFVASVKNLTTKDEFKSLHLENENTEEFDLYKNDDAVNVKKFPLFAFIGKSKSNDDYKIVLNTETKYDNTYDFRTYSLYIYKKNYKGVYSLVKNGGPFLVSLYTDATDISGASIFIGDILKKYFSELEFVFSEKNYEELLEVYESYNSYINPLYIDFVSATPVKKYGFTDTFHNSDTFVIAQSSLTTEKANYEVASYYNSELESSYLLKNGNVGTWSLTAESEELSGEPGITEREEKIIMAYQGLIDIDITNKSLYPATLVFDGNQHTLIKNAIANFLKVRTDIFGFFSILTSEPASKKYPENGFELITNTGTYNFDSYRSALYVQSINIVNEYTNKIQTVTPTYFLAKLVVENGLKYGTYKAVAGEKYGVIGDKNLDIAWIPNPQQREEMVGSKVNYLLKDTTKTFIGTQMTTQKKKSALSDIPVVLTLLKLVEKVEKTANKYIQELFDDRTKDMIKNDIMLNIEDFKPAYENIALQLSQTEYEKQFNKLHITLDLLPKGYIEAIIIDFVIN